MEPYWVRYARLQDREYDEGGEVVIAYAKKMGWLVDEANLEALS
ncbi:hypothetical protein [Halorubellus litoreus]|uniref:Uncharacterized protein n=1 Tax=Halorubellus litoreus TaxID=755308 RepID=A0ABD5VFW9_9EURY